MVTSSTRFASINRTDGRGRGNRSLSGAGFGTPCGRLVTLLGTCSPGVETTLRSLDTCPVAALHLVALLNGSQRPRPLGFPV